MPPAPPPGPLQQRLVAAIEADAPDDVSAAAAAGADVNEPLPNGATPLMWGIAHKKADSVRALLAAGADVRGRDPDGDLPIGVAARFAPPGDATILALLLRAGADPNTHLKSHDPVITWFMRARHLPGIAVLAEHGADLNARTRAGTPLVLEAAVCQYWDVVHTLLQLGADPHAIDGKLSLPQLIGDHRATPPDSPQYPWKRRVWHHLAERGFDLAPLPDAS